VTAPGRYEIERLLTANRSVIRPNVTPRIFTMLGKATSWPILDDRERRLCPRPFTPLTKGGYISWPLATGAHRPPHRNDPM